MRTFLRDVKSGLFFEGRGKWTSNPERALDFKLIRRAIRHAEKAGLQGAELVVASGNPAHLTILPGEILYLPHESSTKWHD